MIKGSDGILDMRLKVMKGVIDETPPPPSMRFRSRMMVEREPTDTYLWETIRGGQGMTPFVAPGDEAPIADIQGHGAGQARAAYWKEKKIFDEVFLNNLRQVGTWDKYIPAQQRLAKELRDLSMRADRREEWMATQMICNNGFSYLDMKSIKLTVSYGIPSTQRVTLAASRYWDSGASRDIMEDIFDMKNLVRDSEGYELTNAVCTTEVLKMMVWDDKIRTLLQKSAFGEGDLFAKPIPVLSALLNINIDMPYDEQYEIGAWITSPLTSGATTIYVDETANFVAGQTLRVWDMSEYDTYESVTISSIDHEAGTITISSALTNSYKVGEDKVTMLKKYLPTDRFIMYTPSIDGENPWTWKLSPFGINRDWGQRTKKKDTFDPEATHVLVENKGLPILKYPKSVAWYVVTA